MRGEYLGNGGGEMMKRIEYESELLAQVKTKPALIDELYLDSSFFTNPTYRTLFEALEAVRNAGLKPDDLTVAEQLNKSGRADLISSYAMLEPISPANAPFYAGKLSEANKKNAIKNALLAATEHLQTANDCAPIVDELFATITDAMTKDKARSAPELDHVASDYALAYEQKYNDRLAGRSFQVSTGIRPLDMMMGGIEPGEVVIIAARPSVGKTALATQIATHCAKCGFDTAFFSLEMSRDEVVERILTQHGIAPLRDLRSALVAPGELHDPLAWLGELPLSLYCGSHDLALMRAELRREKAIHGLKVAFVDYLGLIDLPATGKIPRWQQVSDVSRNLKLLATELALVLFVCVQLTRDAEGKEPTLADLRDSGALEQDADRVLLLSRPDDSTELRNLNIAKNRQGRSGKIALSFEGEKVRFDDGSQR